MADEAFLRISGKPLHDQYFRILCFAHSRLTKLTEDEKDYQSPQQVRQSFMINNNVVDIEGLLSDFQILLDKVDIINEKVNDPDYSDEDPDDLYDKLQRDSKRNKKLHARTDDKLDLILKELTDMKKQISDIDTDVINIVSKVKKPKPSVFVSWTTKALFFAFLAGSFSSYLYTY